MKKVNSYKKTVDVGDRLMVHAYKYNGWLYRIWEYPIVLEKTDDMIVLALEKTYVISSEEKSIRTFNSKIDYPKFWFFIKDAWFNVLASVENEGVKLYINLASPFIYEEGAIKYYDFDLDFKIFPNKNWKEVDINEFFENQRKYKYSKRLIEIITKVEKEVESKIKSKYFEENFSRKKIQELELKFSTFLRKKM